MLLQVPAGLREDHLIGALQTLLDHHDGLRLVAALAQGADFSLEIAPCGTIDAKACLRRIDISWARLTMRWGAALRSKRKRPRMRLSPAAGVMMQAVWFDAGADRARSSAADNSSSFGGRGFVAHPWCLISRRRGVRLRAGRNLVGAARDIVPALGAPAFGGGAGYESGWGAFVLARDAERALCLAG